jgi:hypothetical protein
MSPYPAEYTVAINGLIYDSTRLPMPLVTGTVLGVYRLLVIPGEAPPLGSRDFANPQTAALVPGNFFMGSDGDYANDDRDQNLKKRCLRRMITRPNAFAHLPGYGVGVGTYGKKLLASSVRSRLAAEIERQIRLEPDVVQCQVHSRIDTRRPSLVWFVVLVKSRAATIKFEAPFQAA